MNKPLLHVVIPAYGESPYLRETLLSATRKLARNVPITVLEDPSESNKVREIVSEFLGRVDYQRNNTRLGIAGNFNKSIDISTGVFTWICGSDDLIIKDISPTLKDIYLKNNVAAIISDVIIIDCEGDKKTTLTDIVKKILKPKQKGLIKLELKKFLKSLLLGDWVYFPAVVWNTTMVKDIKFDTKLHTAMDLKIFLELISRDLHIYFNSNKILAYRRHASSASSEYAKNTGRFFEEFECHSFAKKLILEKEWVGLHKYASIALTVRVHIIITLINKFLKKDFQNSVGATKLLFSKIPNK